MISPTAPRYTYPRETWDATKCAKAANHTATDGLGTPYPFKGYVSLPRSVDYNGGTIIKNDWFQGVIRYLPKLARGFKWVSVLSWGWRIVGPDGLPYGRETPAKPNQRA